MPNPHPNSTQYEVAAAGAGPADCAAAIALAQRGRSLILLERDRFPRFHMSVERDFSCASSSDAGDRWLIAGDACSFLGPVFSTGVSIALEEGTALPSLSRRS